jgi:hypothetical protein
MKVLIVGAKGNMGGRYSAIVSALGHEVVPLDEDEGFSCENIVVECDHAIVATPTETHVESIRDIERYTDVAHILCEKPLCKTIEMVDCLFKEFPNLYCVNQYAHLFEAAQFKQRYGFASSWNYTNSGKDGLVWDCFQLFALANGALYLSNESPIWTCVINGVWINHANMAFAYGAMIHDFLGPKKNTWGRDVVMRTTERILASQ